MNHLPTLYTGTLHRDLRVMLDNSEKNYGAKDAFILKHKHGREVSYEHISYSRFREDVVHFATWLNHAGFGGKRIAIIGNNSYQWVVAYLATLCGVGVVVPLDKGLPCEEIATSIDVSQADVLVYDKAHAPIVNRLAESAEAAASIRRFISMDDMSALIKEGAALVKAGDNSYYDHPIDPHAMAIMLFTSGTTSQAKAVMLSHHNLTSNIYGMSCSIKIFPEDMNMAFLPYHHTFGSTGQLVMLHYGACTAFCDGLKYLQKNLAEYHVSVFVCVPLLIEGIYKKIMATAKKQGKDQLLLLMGKLTGFLLKLGIDVRRKVFKSVLDQLGGKLRLIISGASAIDKDALAGFQSFGIMTFQGYGLTETSPVLAAECEKALRLGSVGKPLVNVELKINNPDDQGIGEVIAKCPNMMLGYYNNPEATDAVIRDGWFHTGDLGYFDKDGFLFLCGRAKNVIVLKNGKNVYPEEIETLIAALPYVEENMVFGAEKKGHEGDLTIAAKIVYNKEYVAEHFGVVSGENSEAGHTSEAGSTGNASSVQRPGTITQAELEALIQKDIDAINDRLPTYKQIRRIIVTDVPAIKTTTAKIKRHEEMKNIQL